MRPPLMQELYIGSAIGDEVKLTLSTESCVITDSIFPAVRALKKMAEELKFVMIDAALKSNLGIAP